MEGLPEFISSHARLVFGDESEAILNKRVASIQAVSGTGSLRVGAEFLIKFAPVPKIYIPNVTWVNHWHIFESVGFESIPYSYLDSTGLYLDFDGLQNDLLNCPQGSVVLLHMIAHNPSGIDPSPEQWNRILEIIKSVIHHPSLSSFSNSLVGKANLFHLLTMLIKGSQMTFNLMPTLLESLLILRLKLLSPVHVPKTLVCMLNEWDVYTSCVKILRAPQEF